MDARGCGAACGDEGDEVGLEPFWLSRVAEEHGRETGIVHALFVQFDNGDLEAVFEDCGRVDAHGARDFALDVGQVAEICSPADELVVVVYGEEDDDVVEMGDGAVDLIDIVCDEDVAFVNRALPALQELCDEAAELADEHLTPCVCDDVEFVLLVADRGTHGAAQHQRVHLAANRAQCGGDEGGYQGLLGYELCCRLLCVKGGLFGFLAFRPDQNIAHGIDFAVESRQDERIRIHFCDDGWPVNLDASLGHFGAIPERGLDLLALVDDVLLQHNSVYRRLFVVSLVNRFYGHLFRGVDDLGAHTHRLDFSRRVREAELVFVSLAELVTEKLEQIMRLVELILVKVNGECHGLTLVSHIRLVYDTKWSLRINK